MDATFSSTNSPADDQLLAGEYPRVTTEITVLSGQNLARGALLGRVAGTVTPAPFAGNTGGSGTIASATLGAGAKEGVYHLVCIEPATNAGKFNVYDPDGILVGVATVAVAFAGPINFTITDATDFVSGDGFTVTVAVGTKYVLCAAAATDGSQIPCGILVDAIDATTGDKLGSMYRTGEFNAAAVVFGAGHTAATVRAQLEALQIYLRSTIANA